MTESNMIKHRTEKQQRRGAILTKYGIKRGRNTTVDVGLNKLVCHEEIKNREVGSKDEMKKSKLWNEK